MGILIKKEDSDQPNGSDLISQFVHMQTQERFYRARADYFKSVANSIKAKLEKDGVPLQKNEEPSEDPFVW